MGGSGSGGLGIGVWVADLGGWGWADDSTERYLRYPHRRLTSD